MKKIGRYMRAQQLGTSSASDWEVSNNKGHVLGRIEWNRSWRQHEFLPESWTGFTASCLQPLAAFLQELDLARAGEAARP